MRASTLTATLASTGLLLAASPAMAAESQSSSSAIENAYDKWVVATETADCNGRLVSRHYTKRAILLATFTKYVKGRPAITDYFDGLTCNPDLAVKTKKIKTKRDGSMGYATGLYNFTYTGDEGERVKVPARFTFVFVKKSDGWRIANHHSSENPGGH